MYRVVINITITQVPNIDHPNRNKVLRLSFATDYEITSTWKNFTSGGTITIPKNLYYKSESGEVLPLSGRNVNIGGFTDSPLFLRGDKITITSGYRYVSGGQNIKEQPTIFEGYITKVKAKMPIELTVEDNMYLLKQTPLAPKTFSVSDGLEAILAYILTGTGFTYNALTKTTFGEFTVQNETPAQVLMRLQKLMNLNAYFRGSELRCGVLTYIPSDMVENVFDFNQNIIDDDLDYQRKDDIKLSAVAYNTITELTGAATQDGNPKTRKKKISVLVELLPTGGYKKTVITSGYAPAATEGERRTFFFTGAQTTDELAELAFEQLKKYLYTGFKGSFTTFGIPFVKHGDNVRFKDRYLPERVGTYKVKEVRYTGGVGGLRQEIELDYLVNEQNP